MHAPDTRQPAPEPRLPGISVREAAIRLGTSESDIRRRIKRGELRAESLPRPGGTLLRVLSDPRQDVPGAAPDSDPTPSTAPAPEARQDAPALTMRLLEIVAADRETIREQAETIGRTSAELERAASALVAAESALSASDAALATQTRRARLLAQLLAVLAALAPMVLAVGAWAR